MVRQLRRQRSDVIEQRLQEFHERRSAWPIFTERIVRQQQIVELAQYQYEDARAQYREGLITEPASGISVCRPAKHGFAWRNSLVMRSRKATFCGHWLNNRYEMMAERPWHLGNSQHHAKNVSAAASTGVCMSWRVRIVAGPGQGLSTLVHIEAVLSREPLCDMVLPDKQSSRQHARLSIGTDTVP